MHKDSGLNWLEQQKFNYRQKDLNLTNTKAFATMYREAKAKDMPMAIVNELYLLVCAMAKKEWGETAVVDDFSDPDKLIVRQGRREESV